MAPEVKTVKHLSGIPLMVVGPVDVGRLIRELEQLDATVREAQLRTKQNLTELPHLTKLMTQCADQNKLNLLEATDRTLLMELLTHVRTEAPVLHISFSADPNPVFIEKLMTWLRREIHPLVLMTIGLQPNIGAGCIVRSTNKYFDCSLRQDFEGKRDLLMSKLVPDEATT